MFVKVKHLHKKINLPQKKFVQNKQSYNRLMLGDYENSSREKRIPKTNQHKPRITTISEIF